MPVVTPNIYICLSDIPSIKFTINPNDPLELSTISLFIGTYFNKSSQAIILEELKLQYPNSYDYIMEQVALLNALKTKDAAIVPPDKVWKNFTKVLNAK